MASAGKRKRDGGPPAAVQLPAAPLGLGVEEGLQQFKRAVQELKNKLGSKISAITSLADSQYGFAEEVSKILLDEIATAQVSRLQPLIVVVDSILKKIGKDYKTYLAERMPETIRSCCARSDPSMQSWIQKIVAESWRRHGLLPNDVLDRLDLFFAQPGAVVQTAQQFAQQPPPQAYVPPVQQPSLLQPQQPQLPQQHLLQQAPQAAQPQAPLLPQPQAPQLPVAASAAPGAPQVQQRLPESLLRAGPAPPMKAAPPAKQPRVLAPTAVPAAAVASAAPAPAPSPAQPAGELVDLLSDDEGPPRVNGQSVSSAAHARQVLQGLPSIGFSEAWLRQFVEQMPTKEIPLSKRLEAPSVGRKVLGASGEQMVYVDELSHSEILLLMQFIFLLEERLRRSGGGIDLTQRIPHTFGYLQVEPAIDVMLKRFFGDLPFQCTTTGLRFASQEKLRKHHDELFRRKALQQQRQRGAEARGWMETIPEWVGHRDLVVGPALFRLGEAQQVGGTDDSQRAQEAHQLRIQVAAEAADGEEDEGPGLEEGARRWMCPLDERRAVCPVSGEPLRRTWSVALNDWAFADAVAAEPGVAKPLRFPPGGPMGPHGLSETAVLFQKSCFFSTTPARRLEALEDCRRGPSGVRRGGAEVATNNGVEASVPKQDPELSLLAAPRPARRRFF